MVQDVRAAAQWLATRPNVRGDADCDRRRVARRQPGAAGRGRPAAGPRHRACCRRRSIIGACEPTRRSIKRLGARSIWLAASDRGSAGAAHAARHCRRAVRAARTARLERARARHGAARRGRRRGARRWWTGCAARCYPELSHESGRDRLWHCRQPVRPDHRLGARQPAGGAAAARVAAPVAQAAPAQQQPRGAAAGADRSRARQSARGRRRARTRRTRSRACSWATCSSTREQYPQAITWYEQALAHQPERRRTCPRISAWPTTTRTSRTARWRSSTTRWRSIRSTSRRC